MQMDDNDLCVHEELKHLALTVTEDHHTIVIPEGGDQELLRILLSIHGVISYSPMRKPNPDESGAFEVKLDLTAEVPDWDPSTTRLRELKEAMTDNNGNLKEEYIGSWADCRIVPIQSQSFFQDYNHNDDQDLASALVGCIHYQATQQNKCKCGISSIKSGKHTHAIGHHTLAKNWGISLKHTRRTLEATTQKGIWTVMHLTLSRWFRMNDCQLWYC